MSIYNCKNVQQTNYELYMHKYYLKIIIKSKRMTSKGEKQAENYRILGREFISPLSLHFHAKYGKMLLFFEMCNDAQLLTRISQFLTVPELLTFGSINLRIHELLYSTTVIELRIIKGKLKYYEGRVDKKSFDWSQISLESWSNQEQTLRSNTLIVTKANYRRQYRRQNTTKTNSNLSAYFSMVYPHTTAPHKKQTRQAPKKIQSLQQLKLVNNKLSPPSKNPVTSKRIRSSTPQVIRYHDRILKSYEAGIDKSIIRLNAQKQLATNVYSQTSAAKQINTSLSVVNKQIIIKYEDTCQKQSQRCYDNQFRGIKVPKIMQGVENIVISQQTFFDRLKDRLVRKFK